MKHYFPTWPSPKNTETHLAQWLSTKIYTLQKQYLQRIRGDQLLQILPVAVTPLSEQCHYWAVTSDAKQLITSALLQL